MFCFIVEVCWSAGAGGTRWLSFGEGIIVKDLERVLHLEDSLRMKARPAPLESMVTIVERSALQIRSGPVRALFPKTD